MIFKNTKMANEIQTEKGSSVVAIPAGSEAVINSTASDTLETLKTLDQKALMALAENPATNDSIRFKLMEIGDSDVRIRAIVYFKDMDLLRQAIDLEATEKRPEWEMVLLRVDSLPEIGTETDSKKLAELREQYAGVTKEIKNYAFSKISKETLEDMGY